MPRPGIEPGAAAWKAAMLPLHHRGFNTTTTGFEPARVEPNGFQVHRLNHSATLSF